MAGALPLLALLLAAPGAGVPTYPWHGELPVARSVASLEAPPEGFVRVVPEKGSFGAWLAGLPLLPGEQAVHRFDGVELVKAGDPRVAAVADLDVGARDLQQCADSILRLHAEWLWSLGRADELAPKLTDGTVAPWKRWRQGERLVLQGKRVVWQPRAKADGSRAAFRAWLDAVFTWAGTLSLTASLPMPKPAELHAGDLFVAADPKAYGHAVLLLEVAAHPDGRRVARVGQGFLPAQQFHVLKGSAGSSWLPLTAEGLATPFWRPFLWRDARRLPGG